MEQQELTQLAIAQLEAKGYKRYACECGNVFWYDPKRLAACGNCFQVIFEDKDGFIYKAFGT